MVTSPRQSRVVDAAWRGAPVLATVLLGLGYLAGVVVIESQPTDVDLGPADSLHGWVPGVLVLVQAALLVPRRRFPAAVLLAVVALDVVMLAGSSGELGTGTFAVMVAVYSAFRLRSGRRRGLRSSVAIGAVAVVDTAVALIAVQASDEVPAAWSIPFALLRCVLIFGLPLAIAAVADGRAQLVAALRERAEAAERERERRAEEAVLRERASMARELHDIAAHHLTGIIVSAQAADALLASDPVRASGYLRSLQTDARTTLGNLRQTVGLLRTDDPGDLAPSPSLDDLPRLVAEASVPDAPVRLTTSGEPVPLGPLAGIAVYRMVQESLANALRHAPGPSREVEIDYADSSVRVTVRNSRSPGRATTREAGGADGGGFGLVGMAERAQLIGATLRTGRSPDGGWVNVLVVPSDTVPSDTVPSDTGPS